MDLESGPLPSYASKHLESVAREVGAALPEQLGANNGALCRFGLSSGLANGFQCEAEEKLWRVWAFRKQTIQQLPCFRRNASVAQVVPPSELYA